MSTFLVEIQTISSVQNHPNADRLEIVGFDTLAYTLVAGKGSYQPGDRIIYLPLDAQLPADLIEELGVGPYLSGPDHNVVQTAILRGAASQGIPKTPSSIRSPATATLTTSKTRSDTSTFSNTSLPTGFRWSSRRSLKAAT